MEHTFNAMTIFVQSRAETNQHHYLYLKPIAHDFAIDDGDGIGRRSAHHVTLTAACKPHAHTHAPTPAHTPSWPGLLCRSFR